MGDRSRYARKYNLNKQSMEQYLNPYSPPTEDVASPQEARPKQHRGPLLYFALAGIVGGGGAKGAKGAKGGERRDTRKCWGLVAPYFEGCS